MEAVFRPIWLALRLQSIRLNAPCGERIIARFRRGVSYLFQLLRTLIWVAGAWLIIRGSRLPRWQTALIVGLMLSVPQNIGHLIPNPVIPLNSVRISHMIETASSTFIFGLIVAWLLYPKYVFKKP